MFRSFNVRGRDFFHYRKSGVAVTTTVKRYRKPNLEGLDLGGLKGQKKRYTYLYHYFFA